MSADGEKFVHGSRLRGSHAVEVIPPNNMFYRKYRSHIEDVPLMSLLYASSLAHKCWGSPGIMQDFMDDERSCMSDITLFVPCNSEKLDSFSG